MAVLQMQKVSICALKKDRKAILEKIQSMGVMEISRFESEEEGFQTVNTQEDRSAFEKNAALADTALNILQEYVPEKVSMFASLEGKDLIEKSKYLETAHREKEVLDMAAQVVKLHKQTAECKANVQKLENQIEALRPWMNLDIPGDFQGTETAAVLIGSMSGSLTLEDIYSLILEQAPEVSGVDISILSSERSCGGLPEKRCGKSGRNSSAEWICQAVSEYEQDSGQGKRRPAAANYSFAAGDGRMWQ